MKRILSISLTVIILCLFVFSNISAYALEETTPSHQGVVSLQNKKIMVIGNSMVYYGNCVIYGRAGKSDNGYLYQLIKQNGEDAIVIDHTYPGKNLEYIYDKYISGLSSEKLDVDYVVLSEANQYNDNLLGTVEKYKALFPEDVEFRFLRHPMMFESDLPCLIEGVQTLRDNGYTVVDWGQLVYDVYNNGKTVPGATLEFSRCSFLKENVGYNNGSGNMHSTDRDGDRKHPNPLSGYITAQMLYSSITNRSAVFTDYSFCYDNTIHPYFDLMEFEKVHYTDPNHPTNMSQIFRSPQDMTGLQKLMDEYLIAEGLHPLTVSEGFKPTCVNSGMTVGSYCPICGITVDIQEFIPNDKITGHKEVIIEGIPATCTKTGLSNAIGCSECGEILVPREITPAVGHSYETMTTAPTCINSGYTVRYCTDCGYSYISDVVSAEDHTFVKNETVKATCTSIGANIFTCSDCGDKHTEVIPAKAHTAVELKAKAATCTKTGLTKGSKCSVCDTILTAQKTVAKKAHSYKTTTTKATLKKNGKIVKKCTVCGKTASTTTIYYAKTVKLKKATFTYTGKTIKPTLVVKNSKGKTISSKYYTVSGTKSTKNIGKHKITLKFKGRYSGTKTLYYTINPKTVASLKLKAGKKQMTVSYKKDSSVGGYEIMYATNKSFKKAKTTKATSAKKTIKKLTSKKTYYVKVRAYKKVSGKTYYGAYCKAKTVKVK